MSSDSKRKYGRCGGATRVGAAQSCETTGRLTRAAGWGYFRLAEVRRPIFRLEGWIRRHIRKCFWIRWHSAAGRERALRRLGLRGRMLKAAFSSRGAWHLAGTGSLQTALSNAALRRYGFLMPSDLAAL